MRPVGKRVIVLAPGANETTTPSGIVQLPDTSARQLVGKGVVLNSGVEDVAKGAAVLYRRHGARLFQRTDEGDVCVVDEENILVVLEKEANAA